MILSAEACIALREWVDGFVDWRAVVETKWLISVVVAMTISVLRMAGEMLKFLERCLSVVIYAGGCT